MTETSPNGNTAILSRFQLLSSPVATPGKCACCGTATRPVVDFGMTLEFYGAVYLCETCLTEAARTIGMVTPTEYAEATSGSSQSFSEQLIARDMVAIPRGQYDAIALAIRGLSNMLLPASFSGSDVVATPAEPAGPDLFDFVTGESGSLDAGSDEGNAGGTGTPEQESYADSDEGPLSVPANSVNGSPFLL